MQGNRISTFHSIYSWGSRQGQECNTIETDETKLGTG